MDPYNLALELRSIGAFLRRQAEAIPERPYLTIGGRTYGFGETDARCRALARGFAERGIGEGGRVMLMLPSCAESVFVWYALSLIGAAAVPVNPDLRGSPLAGLVADAAVDAVVVHADCLGALVTIDTALKRRIPWAAVVGTADSTPVEGDLATMIDFNALYVGSGADPTIADDFRRIQVISYTSGTTGPAKGVMIPNAQCFSAACTFMKVIGMTREDTLYTPLPLFHGLSSRMGCVPALVLGAQVVIDDRFSASRYWERAAACGATLGQVVHAVAPLIKAQPAGAYDRAHRVRAIFNCAHDPEFEARFGVRMTRAFSMTETNFLIYTPYPERKTGTVGRAHEDWELALVDERDCPVPEGAVGELVARPRRPYIWMQGYLNKPAQTLETVRNLWFHTGDLMRRDAEGYFHYVDRKRDRIRRRGENVSSSELEHAVAAHEAIAECVVLAHPAGDGEDEIRVVAVVKAGAALAPAALHAWLKERLPRFMWPRYIELVATLPRTGTDKVEKQLLLAQGLGPTAWDAQRA